MKVLSLLFAVIIILGVNIPSSYAQEGFVQPPPRPGSLGPRCKSRISMVEMLTARRYNEAQKVVLYVNNETIIELFVNEETGTWTLVASTADGKSCFMASGPMHQIKKSVLPGESS